MLLGSENPMTLKGIYLDGVVPDEYGEMHPSVWSEAIRPTLSDRKGWAIFLGTPKGQNDFYKKYTYAKNENDPEWYSAMFKASETGIIDADELESNRKSMTEEEYLQEYECSFSAALLGAYYAKSMDRAEKENRITSVPYDSSVPVETFWDLGIGDSNAIWFIQQVGKEIHVIDYLENSGQGLDFYAKELTKKPYYYGEHVLPHDAAAKELGTGVSRQETMRKLGIGRTRILPKQSPEDRINAGRLLIDRSWFDMKKCERGIDCIRNYQSKWDMKNQIFSTAPLHNWASHGADAWGYAAIGLQEDRTELRKKLNRDANEGYDHFSHRSG
jgi:phage terminase large subunit